MGSNLLAIATVLWDFDPKISRAYLQTDPEEADRETVLNLLMSASTRPVQVLASIAARPDFSRYTTLESFT